MSLARSRGHGQVSRYLEQMGVPRSTAYRWEADLRCLIDFGPSQLRELRREHQKLRAELARLRQEPSGGRRMSGAQERAFILEAAVLGNSDQEVGAMLRAAGGRSLSHQTIYSIIEEAAAVARVVYARYFAGVGAVGAADEIFLGHSPLLLMVEPLSLLIGGLRLAARRTAKDWEPLFAQMADLEGCAADGGRAIGKAAGDAHVPVHADMFHLLRSARAWLASLQRSYEAKMRALAEAQQAFERAQFRGEKKAGLSACRRRDHARRAAERMLEEYCRLGDLLERIGRALDYTTPDGKLRTARASGAIVAEALEEMKQTPEGRRLGEKLGRFERQPAFAHLEVIEAGLAEWGLEQVGPSRQARLGRLVAETVAWRRTDKDPVEVLEAVSNGTLADKIEIAVIKVVDRAIRSSSSVECVNARVRLVQVARKRLSEDFVCLLAVHHNMKPFGRGSVREGRTPAELAGIELPTNDWVELLDLTAKEFDKAAPMAA